MAASSKSIGRSVRFETLDTYADLEKVKQTKDTLIVVLYNLRYLERFKLESRMTNWRTTNENSAVQFYKYVAVDGDQDIKQKLKINGPPAVIFFHNGEQLETINDFIESNPNQSDPAGPTQESSDEKKLKARLEYWCNKTK